jgi:tRNA pseudouridine32 synthase/23S rRNA pseudouridine746 synthase
MMMLPPTTPSLVLLFTLIAFKQDHSTGLCVALMPQSFSKRKNTSIRRSPFPTQTYLNKGRRTNTLGSSSASSETTATEQIQIETTHIPILLETEHVFVVNKPTGISHANSDHELGILNVLRGQQEQGLLSYTGRLYGVHRLDRVTSGILVLAKDAPTARRLTAAFREGLVTKYYTGISRHKPATKKQGWVTGGMVRGRRKSWQLTRSDSKSKNDGSESIPNYARTRFFTAGLGGLSDALVQNEDESQSQVQQMQPKTLLLFRPYTGRTHQLRVAAKSVGLALTGDPVYSDGGEQPETTFTDTPRTYLHATGFYLPGSEEDGTQDITIWSPPPFDHLWDESGQDEFQTILNKLLHKHCDCPAILEMLE